MQNDPQIVRVCEMQIYGPGPGVLRVRFSESSLYDHPFISHEPVAYQGIVYSGSFYEGEYTLTRSFVESKSIWNCPETISLTDEQDKWLKQIIPSVAEKFKDMNAVLDLAIFD